jgi:hypothetical protein
MTRVRARSWAVFDRRYGPTDGPDGTPLRNWDDPAVQSADDRLVWTVVDCDGRTYLVPGFATVNYLGRVLCRRPWADAEFSGSGYVY